MSRRILVTGASGTVGGVVMRHLAQMSRTGGFDVVGAARSDASSEKLQLQGHASILFDYDRPETLGPAMQGVDSLFLATGYTVDMLVHAKRALDAAKKQNVRHIVHLGALAPDDTPHAHFAWHQIIEHTIRSMGFAYTNLHPNFFIDTVWGAFKQRPDRVVHFVGDQKVSFISSDDMAEVAAMALADPDTHAGQDYQLATEALTFFEVAEILTEVTGKPVEYRPRPAADLLPILLKQQMEPVYAKSLAEGVAAIEAGDVPMSGATYDTVAKVTGHQPVGWREMAEAHKHEIMG
jgi:NAD(P)H dehydrogenase (quinone)